MDNVENLFLEHLYNAITIASAKGIELKPDTVYATHGFMNLSGKIRIGAYSNDHGTHFHVQLVAEDIDARFTYPDIELDSYVSKKRFTSTQIKNIQTTCRIQQYHDFIGQELTKRE